MTFFGNSKICRTFVCVHRKDISGISRIKQNLLRDYSLGIFKLYNDNI